MIIKELIDKNIKTIHVTGNYVTLTTKDGYEFHYDASDGGYSTWSCRKTCNRKEKNNDIGHQQEAE